MSVKCRYPACGAHLHTSVGRDYHEEMIHGMVFNKVLQPFFQQIRQKSNVSEIHKFTEQQLQEVQDRIYTDTIKSCRAYA